MGKKSLSLLITGFGVASFSACLSGPGFFEQDGSGPPPRKLLDVQPLAKGGVKATVLSDATETQVIRPTKGSGVEHSEVSFPPGSLSVDTSVVVEEGEPIVSDSTAKKLGMKNENTLASNESAVLVQSENKQNTAKPFTIALGAPDSEQSLGLKEGAYEVVVYKVEDAETGALELGLVPTDSLTFKKDKIVVETTRFGIFQTALSGEKIEKAVKTETTVPIASANDAGESFEIAEATPYVAPAGETVTLSGKNFRESMTIAMGGSSVGGLIVENDTEAKFTVPDEVPFGFAELRAAQGDTARNLILFAQAHKDELPLITMDPSGVCNGVTYYDANGTKQTGTKKCGGNMKKSTYDSDNDGKVDGAASADHAQQATKADFSVGTAGTSVTAASTLSLPDDGSVYEVNGTTTITDIETKPKGTSVGLLFQDSLTMQNDPASLSLAGSKDLQVISGDYLELTHLDSRWRETGRALLNGLSKVDMSGGDLAVTNGSYNNDFWNTELQDSLDEFDDSSSPQAFTAARTATYLIDYVVDVGYDTNPFCGMGSCDMTIIKNGTEVHSDTNGTVSSTSCANSGSVTLKLSKGDVLNFEVYAYGNNVSTTKILSTSQLSIKSDLD